MAALENIFSSAGMAPHGWCLLWDPRLLAFYIFSDVIIGISYYAIPMALVYFIRNRKDLIFGWVFWMFALFILACGTTHWFEILTIWYPAYWIESGIKLVTAAASIATAIGIWLLMPRALALPSPSQFRDVSTALSSEVEHRETVSRVLAASQQRFQLLVESVTDCAIYSLDPYGVIMDWNKGAERIKGYK